jgi:hypothetical protein
MSNQDDPCWVFFPEEEAVVPPPGIIQHIKDHWWAYHPQKGLLFYRKGKRGSMSPQCNSSEELCRRLNAHLHPWAEVKFFPSVFFRVNPHDYI